MTDRGSVEAMSTTAVRPLRRAEYDLLVEHGAFAGERIELLDGELVEVSPQDARHATMIEALSDHLLPPLVARARVRIQLPLAAGDLSEPEPDVAIVPRDEPREVHPSRTWHVIEVADSSVRHDLTRKARIYAAAGVPVYWVVDLPGRAVHVHTGPVDGRYTEVVRHGPDDVLDVCGVPVSLAELERGRPPAGEGPGSPP